MQNYQKIYLDYFGLTKEDFMFCEVCMGEAQEIHHLNGRLGDKNNIKNLVAICRSCHTTQHKHNSRENREKLKELHQKFMQNPPYQKFESVK